MNYTLSKIARAVGAELVLPASDATTKVPTKVGTDSRTSVTGELFVCLIGKYFDGHDHAAAAVAAGAIAILGSRSLSPVPRIPYLRVTDSLVALGRLGHFHRSRTRATVVGITGTAGKTTTKELLAGILDLAGPTARNFLNLNNRIGLPLSLLQATGDEYFWVFEVGISKFGEMEDLADILAPDLALVLNIGPGHLQGLGDITDVAAAKCRLMRGMTSKGTGLVCMDYPELVASAAATGRPWINFSCRGAMAPYRGRFIKMTTPDTSSAPVGRFLLHLDDIEIIANIPWAAPFLVENITAAAAAAHWLGLTPDIIRRGLEAFTSNIQRFRCVPAGGWLVIDDTYNANPLSTAAALDGALTLASGQPLVLFLSEMHELGIKAAAAHKALGRSIAALAPAGVFWYGGHVKDILIGLNTAGYVGAWQSVVNPADCMPLLRTISRNNSIPITRTCSLPVLLIKGSRSNHMERFTQALIEELMR
ncbi:UDP-N-acetylmuramoyl-tripeptide--D-alanyl-D-alanine ligase [Desulfovibrionales bacterium]